MTIYNIIMNWFKRTSNMYNNSDNVQTNICKFYWTIIFDIKINIENLQMASQ